ncbi:hypothetical protein CEXT_768581 [Caerostris extrusa]|uniref:Uncharacterized protein n=1 Tax=Caerostris extrusa TaxID=172846 RepID=A0AAV4MQZ2_CAEEX|nr:hypothetical protein CEXT_768581 [Caerostris extrusa]
MESEYSWQSTTVTSHCNSNLLNLPTDCPGGCRIRKQHEDAALMRNSQYATRDGENKSYGLSVKKAIITMEEYTRYRELRWRLCYRLKQKRSGDIRKCSESMLMCRSALSNG